MTEENVELCAQKLLEKVVSITKKYEMISRETGENFNIFQIADIGTNERVVCRILRELLSPVGNHGQDGAYLEIFLRDCLGMDFEAEEINKAKVYPEVSTNEDRYIDLVIQVGDVFIPIEVKINARDQPRQCYDYYKFAESKSKNIKTQLIYLTRDGRRPSADSAEGPHGLTKEYYVDDESNKEYYIDNDGNKVVGYKEIKQISFSYDILNWLRKCLMLPDTIKKAPVREIIMQLIRMLKIMTNQLEDDMKDEIVKEILNSPEMLKSAIEISQTPNECRKRIIMKIFDDLVEQINEKHGLVCLSNIYDYKSNEKLLSEDYVYPGISYKLCDLKIGLELWLRLEVANFMIIGFCIAENNRCYEKPYKDDIPAIVSDNINQKLRFKNSWWYSRDYIEENNTTPNFNYKDGYNDMYYEMLKPSSHKEFIEKTINKFTLYYKSYYKGM